MLAAPQNSAANSQAATTVFKRPTSVKETAKASDGKLQWRERRSSGESRSSKVVPATSERTVGAKDYVTPAVASENASPILRAANESVLAPNELPRSARPAPKAVPRRLSPLDTRRAKTLPTEDEHHSTAQRNAPADTPRRYGEGEIPPAERPGVEAPAAEVPPADTPPAEGVRPTPMDEQPAAPPAERPAVEQPTMDPLPMDPPPIEQPMAQPMDDPGNGMTDPARTRNSPPTKEECEHEARLRNEYLFGKQDPSERRIGEFEYCDKSRELLNKRDVVDIPVDISPPKPKDLDAPKCDRDWRDMTGKILFEGRPEAFDVSTGRATFRTTDGQLRTIPLRELHRDDQGHFMTMYLLPVECLPEGKPYLGRSWVCSTFTWKASGACHKPLYFEDVHLERYGHSWGPLLQPGASAVHFFGTFPILPYKMGLQPPHECIYTLGYYRPGNCAPHMLDPLPLSARAAFWEAGAWVAGVAIIP